MMSDVTAFGAANEMDILIDGCYTSLIPDGVRAIGIAGLRDEVALALSAPLTIGVSYTISFYSRSEVSFRPRGDVEIGASTSSTAFGTAIYTAVTVESTWIYHEFTFTATEASTHITARNVTGAIYWNHLDHFVMLEPIEEELEITPTHPTCFGSCDGSATLIDGALGPYTYLWDAAAGSATTATATGLCAGTYSVEVTNDAGGVVVVDVTLVDPEELIAGIIDQTDVTCFDGTDGYVAIEGSGGTGALLYDIGAGGIDPGEFAGLAAGTYTVTVSDENGCTVDIPVEILEPSALILSEVSLADVSCNGLDDGEIEVIGSGGTGTYTYSIDGVTFGAATTFSALAAGAYTITVRDENACEATADFIIVEPAALELDHTITGESCAGDCTGTIEVGVISGGLAPYSFSNDACVTLQPTGSFTDLCAGDYILCVSDANGCSVNETVTVTAGDPPLDATLMAMGPFCADDAPAAIVGVDLGVLAGPGVVGGVFNPALAGPGSHTIINTLLTGCGGTASITVVVNALPTVSFMAPINSGCAPVQVDFTSTGEVGVTCAWTFGDGANATLCGAVSHTYTTPGSYDVSLTITNASGCSASAYYADYVDVFVLPTADFILTTTDYTTLNTEVDFRDASDYAASWDWDFDGFGNSTVEDPTFIFPDVAGTYEITLTVTTADGCTDEITKSIRIAEEQIIFVPNAFTPDGDSFNETFKPYIAGIDIYDYHLVIYNRWGEMIFESYDPSRGWNGTYGSGEIVQDGVYIWHISAGDILTDKIFEFDGHVTVIK